MERGERKYSIGGLIKTPCFPPVSRYGTGSLEKGEQLTIAQMFYNVKGKVSLGGGKKVTNCIIGLVGVN
jgi:hypothetical protein